LYIANSTEIEESLLADAANAARNFGWQVYEAPKLNERGIPIFKHMYMDVAQRVPNCGYYTYSNGDILYSHDIIETLEETSEVTAMLRLSCSSRRSRKPLTGIRGPAFKQKKGGEKKEEKVRKAEGR